MVRFDDWNINIHNIIINSMIKHIYIKSKEVVKKTFEKKVKILFLRDSKNTVDSRISINSWVKENEL